jgi:drug/metabolite transporter (DMT)-like permease
MRAMLTVVDHPLARHLLTQLRDRETPPSVFRTLTKRLTAVLVLEATRDLPTEEAPVMTPLEEAAGRLLAKPLVAVPILRAGLGMAGILGSCFLFSFSSVWLKKLNSTADAFNQTAGALLFALPGLLLVWYVLDGGFPAELSTKSLAAISYLAVCGSLLGFTLFFYVLQQMSPSSVSLITLITPVLALTIGTWVAGEAFTGQLLLGTGLVLAALMIYLDMDFARRVNAWWGKAGR